MNYSNSNLNTLGVGDGKVVDEFTQGIDGSLIEYDVLTADNPIRANYDEDFYEAGGLFSGFRKAQKKREARRALREKSKAEARTLKAKAKLESSKAKRDQAKAQQLSAKASEKGVQADIEMAKALANKPAEAEKKGMSTGAKVGIAIGVVAVLGLVGFVIYKKMKGKGGK